LISATGRQQRLYENRTKKVQPRPRTLTFDSFDGSTPKARFPFDGDAPKTMVFGGFWRLLGRENLAIFHFGGFWR
jgi:hypothetical protein